jgi:iron complex transport system substrate-binding protein
MRTAAIVGVLVVAVVVVFLLRREEPEPVPEPEVEVEQEEGERIVSIAPNVTETLFALGLGDVVVGRSAQCDYPPEAAAIPSMGSGMEPDVERIIAARPTAVVASSAQAEYPVIEAVSQAGIEVLLVDDKMLHEYFRSVEALGERFERTEEATAIVQSIQAAFDQVTANRTSPDFISTAFVVGTDPIYLAGTQTYVDEMVRRSGGDNNVFGEWVRHDDEAFIAYGPQLIIHAVNEESELATWDRFGDSVPAVVDGRICAVNADLVARVGPRLAEAIGEIEQCVQRHLPGTEGLGAGADAAAE